MGAEGFWREKTPSSVHQLIKLPEFELQEDISTSSDANNADVRGSRDSWGVYKDLTSWAAQIVWFGPYNSWKKASKAAQKIYKRGNQLNYLSVVGNDDPDFGLFMAIGSNKSKSNQVLYVGANSDRADDPIWSAIEQKRSYEGNVAYYFGLLTAPRLKYPTTIKFTEMGNPIIVGDAEYVKRALIYALNPNDYNGNDGKSRPDYNFILLNKYIRSSCFVSNRRIRTHIPECIELNLLKEKVFYNWSRLNGRTYTDQIVAPEKTKNVCPPRRKWTRILEVLRGLLLLILIPVIGIIVASSCPICEDCESCRTAYNSLMAQARDLDRQAQHVLEDYFEHEKYDPKSVGRDKDLLEYSDEALLALRNAAQTNAGKAALTNRDIHDVFLGFREGQICLNNCANEKQELWVANKKLNDDLGATKSKIYDLEKELERLRISNNKALTPGECVTTLDKRIICLMEFNGAYNLVEYGKVIRPVAAFPDQPEKAER